MRSRAFQPSIPIILLYLAVAVYAVIFAYLTITRYAAFEARALDMGNLNQAIWNTAHGNWFHLTNQEGVVNRLSLHVEPILLPISVLYRVYPAPPTLLLLQAIIVALGALPVFTLARYRQFGQWAALAFAVTFLLNPTIQAANWLEFHPVTLAPTFLLAAFYFLVKRRYGWYALFALLAVSCKEEISLLLFMVGLYALLALKERRAGILTMALSLAWAAIAVFVVQNAFAAGNIHWGRYAYLGDTPAQMVRTLLTQPATVWSQLRDAGALRYLLQIVLPFAFTPLVGLELLALALPSFALNLLADFSPMHQVYTLIYAAPIVPFAVIAAIYGSERLSGWLPNQLPERLSRRGLDYRGIIAGIVLIFALYASLQHGYLPGGGQFTHYTVSDHDRITQSIIDLIPADAKVSAQDRLDPHASGRETIYIFPRIEDADTVLVDVTGPSWPQHPNDVRTTLNELLASGFGVEAADDGVLLLSKRAPSSQIPDGFYSAWRRRDHVPDDPMEVDFADQLRLMDVNVRLDEHGETLVDIYWQALRPLDTDYDITIAMRDRSGDTLFDSTYYPPATLLWYPTSQWEPEQTTLVQTLPWSPEADEFSLYVGVSGADRLKIVKAVQGDSPLPVLDGDTLVRLGAFERTNSGQWVSVPPDESTPNRDVQAVFAQHYELEGATLPDEASVEEDLAFRLYFRALSGVEEVDKDYSLFAHLLDANGERVAQLDWQPRDSGGLRPTSSWTAGERIVDSEVMELPMNLATGEYRMVVGLYDWESGDRLPVTSGTDTGQELVHLGTITVKSE